MQVLIIPESWISADKRKQNPFERWLSTWKFIGVQIVVYPLHHNKADENVLTVNGESQTVNIAKNPFS